MAEAVDPYVNVRLIESVEIAPNSAYTNQKKKMSPLIMFTLLLDRFELTVITSVGATNRRGVGASLTWWGRDPGKNMIGSSLQQKGPFDSNYLIKRRGGVDRSKGQNLPR